MITIPITHKSVSDEAFLIKKQIDYAYAFHKIHKGLHRLDDGIFPKYIQTKFNLTDIEFRSLVSQVKCKFEQTVTEKADKEQKIVELSKEILELEKEKKSNKITRQLFKKRNKIKHLEDSLLRDITFGGKETLRKLTKLHNKINEINLIKDPKERQKELNLNREEINKQRTLWENKRVLSFYLLGEANQKGNRFFDFDFANKTLIYKPFKGKKIEIKYSCFGTHQETLLKLQPLIDSKLISITLNISKNKTSITFDNTILSGYYFDKTERTKEIKEVKKKNYSTELTKDLINEICKKYHEGLRAKKLEGKIENRFMAVDLNPEYIGFCIADKGENDIKKIVKKGVIDLRGLNEKLGLSSDNPLVKCQNNKRKHELINSLRSLFDMAIQYKVAYFVSEDIENIGKNKSLENKTANRKVKNIWHREITNWQIEKQCTANGIEHLKVIPAYTSFIGNIIYDNFDATNAALEICRRGMFKFTKGLFYPQLTGTNFDTMSKIMERENVKLNLRDAQNFKDCRSWVELYKIAAHNGLRWRWDWEMVEKPHSIFSMDNPKSKVNFIIFN